MKIIDLEEKPTQVSDGSAYGSPPSNGGGGGGGVDPPSGRRRQQQQPQQRLRQSSNGQQPRNDQEDETSYHTASDPTVVHANNGKAPSEASGGNIASTVRQQSSSAASVRQSAHRRKKKQYVNTPNKAALGPVFYRCFGLVPNSLLIIFLRYRAARSQVRRFDALGTTSGGGEGPQGRPHVFLLLREADRAHVRSGIVPRRDTRGPGWTVLAVLPVRHPSFDFGNIGCRIVLHDYR